MTLKIQLLSDTHMNGYCVSSDADLIVHLGDFGNGGAIHIQEFADKCEAISKPYLFVLGNHDYYFNDYSELKDKLESKYPDNLLTEGKEIVVGGYTFVGDTLHTNFKLFASEDWETDQYKLEAQACISDFRCVKLNGKLVTPADYLTMFNRQYNWIKGYRGRDDVVVLTHFLPNIHCIDPYWLNHPTCWRLNAYFASNINVKGFKNWWFAHTHSAVDKVVDGCRLLCNPLGYVSELGSNGYRENLIIELPQL